jgi:hypothetical protein
MATARARDAARAKKHGKAVSDDAHPKADRRPARITGSWAAGKPRDCRRVYDGARFPLLLGVVSDFTCISAGPRGAVGGPGESPTAALRLGW